jgi:hypothetical protein
MPRRTAWVPSRHLCRGAVAIGAAAIRRLEPLLIFAFELLGEDDATKRDALFARALGFAHIRTIQLSVVM